MFENCNCIKFHDITLTEDIRLVFTVASNDYQTALFHITGGHFNWKEKNDFGQLTSAAMSFATFHAVTIKSLLDFWPPLLEKQIKFVLSCEVAGA